MPDIGGKSDRPLELVARIVRERHGGASLSAIAAGLSDDGVPTAHGAEWWPATIAKCCRAGCCASEIWSGSAGVTWAEPVSHLCEWSASLMRCVGGRLTMGVLGRHRVIGSLLSRVLELIVAMWRFGGGALGVVAATGGWVDGCRHRWEWRRCGPPVGARWAARRRRFRCAVGGRAYWACEFPWLAGRNRVLVEGELLVVVDVHRQSGDLRFCG